MKRQTTKSLSRKVGFWMALSIPILAGTICPAATRFVSPNGLEIALC